MKATSINTRGFPNGSIGSGVGSSKLWAILTVSLKLAFPMLVIAQEVKIRHLELVQGDMILSYELIDENPDKRYSIHLYSSQDNFIQPLVNVDGDVGIDIGVGENKVVTWHAREELGADFKGDISLELQGNVYVPFIELESFEAYGTLKRGKPYDFTWAGGRGDNVLKFELYREDKRVKVFEERANVGNTALTIPTDVKPGKRYRFRISDVRNMDEVVYSGSFDIKRKVPLALKAGLGIIVGGVLGYMAGTVSGGEGPGEAKIVEPPLPKR